MRSKLSGLLLSNLTSEVNALSLLTVRVRVDVVGHMVAVTDPFTVHLSSTYALHLGDIGQSPPRKVLLH